jgi:hypothetical protein
VSSQDAVLARSSLWAYPVVFLLARLVLRLPALGPKQDDKDIEIAVLRHQLSLLRRQVPPTPLHPVAPGRARTPQAAPRPSWSVFPITAATLRCWQTSSLDTGPIPTTTRTARS